MPGTPPSGSVLLSFRCHCLIVERLGAGSHCQAYHGSGFGLEQRAEAGAELTIEARRLRARRRINPGRAIDRYARAALGSPNAFDRDLLEALRRSWFSNLQFISGHPIAG